LSYFLRFFVVSFAFQSSPPLKKFSDCINPFHFPPLKKLGVVSTYTRFIRSVLHQSHVLTVRVS